MTEKRFSGIFRKLYNRIVAPLGSVSRVHGHRLKTLSETDPSVAALISGTIVAAAIINEIIAVIVAKFAFKWAGEIKE